MIKKLKISHILISLLLGTFISTWLMYNTEKTTYHDPFKYKPESCNEITSSNEYECTSPLPDYTSAGLPIQFKKSTYTYPVNYNTDNEEAEIIFEAKLIYPLMILNILIISGALLTMSILLKITKDKFYNSSKNKN